MTSERMTQAAARIDRAITRLEGSIAKAVARATAAEEALARATAAAETARPSAGAASADLFAVPAPRQDEGEVNPFSHDKALAALRSLDSLIDDLQKARRDG